MLARCLNGPAPLRAAAIDAYPIRVPVGTGNVLYSPAAYILHLSATIIHERGGQWFRVRADERTLAVPLRVHDLGGLAELQDYVSRLGDVSQIGRLADGRTRLMAEVRLDGAIPYGVVARILAASGYIQDVPVDFDQPSLSGLAVVCANPPASYLADEKTLLFNPAGKISRLITIELIQRPGGRIDISEDGKRRPAVEGAAINSLERLQQFRYAFDPRPDYDGFKANPVVVVRATPNVAWSDVVAACEAQFPLRSVMLGHPLEHPINLENAEELTAEVAESAETSSCDDSSDHPSGESSQE